MVSTHQQEGGQVLGQNLQPGHVQGAGHGTFPSQWQAPAQKTKTTVVSWQVNVLAKKRSLKSMRTSSDRHYCYPAHSHDDEVGRVRVLLQQLVESDLTISLKSKEVEHSGMMITSSHRRGNR